MDGFLVVKECEAYQGLARTPEWGPEDFLTETFSSVTELVDEEWLSHTEEAGHRARELLNELFSSRLELVWIADDPRRRPPDRWELVGFDIATTAPYESALFPVARVPAARSLNAHGLVATFAEAKRLHAAQSDSRLRIWSVWMPRHH